MENANAKIDVVPLDRNLELNYSDPDDFPHVILLGIVAQNFFFFFSSASCEHQKRLLGQTACSIFCNQRMKAWQDETLQRICHC